MKHLTQNQKVDLLMAMKLYEDKLQEIVTEPVFDDWLDRIPLDVDQIKYTAMLKAMVDNLRKYRKPTRKQITLTLDLGFANLKYS